METWRRKARGAEITVKSLREERDAAVAQLGIAYISHEEVKADHDALLEENEQFKAEIARLKGLYESISSTAPSSETLDENVELKSEVAKLKREALAKRTSTLETAEENGQLRDEVARLRRESSSKRTAGLETAEENQQLKTEVARLKRETFSRRTQTSEVVQENDRLKEEVARLTVLCESSSKRASSTQVIEENHELKTELARLIQESSNRRGLNSRYAEENEQLKAEVARLKTVCESFARRSQSTETVKRTHTGSKFSTFPTISEQDYTQVLDVDLDPKARGIPPIAQPETIPSNNTSKPAQQAPKKRKTRLVLEEYSESETSEAGEARRPSNQQRDNNTTRFTSVSTHQPIDDNETTGLLSNVSVSFYTLSNNLNTHIKQEGEIVALQRRLEAERRSQNVRKARAPKGRFVVSNQIVQKDDTQKSIDANMALPRRSSMKDLTGRLSERGQQEEDLVS